MNVPALSQALLVLRTVGEQVAGVLGSCDAGVISIFPAKNTVGARSGT